MEIVRSVYARIRQPGLGFSTVPCVMQYDSMEPTSATLTVQLLDGQRAGTTVPRRWLRFGGVGTHAVVSANEGGSLVVSMIHHNVVARLGPAGADFVREIYAAVSSEAELRWLREHEKQLASEVESWLAARPLGEGE